jgi:hypothetical protein
MANALVSAFARPTQLQRFLEALPVGAKPFPHGCPQVGRLAVEMLKKENFANCGHDLL